MLSVIDHHLVIWPFDHGGKALERSGQRPSKCRGLGTSCMRIPEQRDGWFQECRTAVMYRSINRFSILSLAGEMEMAR